MMANNYLQEIGRAYEAGDIDRARALIHDALTDNPTPQLYRLAAELAVNQEQKDYFLVEARVLEAASGVTQPTRPDGGPPRTCPHCGALNASVNVYCDNCTRSLDIADTPVGPPSTPSRSRGLNTRKILIVVIVLFVCLWAVALLYAGIRLVRNSDRFTAGPNLTETAYSGIFATLESAASPTVTPPPEEPTHTVVPTQTFAPTQTDEPSEPLPPTKTALPTSDVPGLAPGRVTTEDYNFYNPAVSPNHQSLAAAIAVGDNWQIVEIDPISGLITRRITDSNYVYVNPHYASDGQTLLVKANILGSSNLYLVDVETGGIRQTLTDFPESVGYPRWMPNFQSYLYKRDINQAAEIYIGYLDGSAHTRLTDNNRYDGSPASSPDGRLIAMSSFIDGNYEIVVLDRDSGEFKQLTFHSGRDSEPIFSPDGNWIAFESDRGGDYDIWTIRPDGSDLRQVTSDSRNELIPAFSFDGSWLYFQQRQGDGNFSINRQIWP